MSTFCTFHPEKFRPHRLETHKEMPAVLFDLPAVGLVALETLGCIAHRRRLTCQRPFPLGG